MLLPWLLSTAAIAPLKTDLECESWMLANLAGAVPDVLEEAAPLIIAECEAALEALGSGLAGDCATFIQWMGVIRHSEDGLVRFAKHVCRVQDAPEASQNRRALGWSDWVTCTAGIVGGAAGCSSVIACGAGVAGAVAGCGGLFGGDDSGSGTGSLGWTPNWRCDPEKRCGIGEGDVSVDPDQCLDCEWACDAPDSSWMYTGQWRVVGGGNRCCGLLCVENAENYCKRYECSIDYPPPSPAPPPIPVGECRPLFDYGKPDSSMVLLSDVVQETCSDFPAELVELYLGDSCENLLCDGSQKAPSERPLYIQATLAFCPAKCGGCNALCQDKPELLQEFHKMNSNLWPSSCTADWPAAFPGTGFCDDLYRMACAATATPGFCPTRPPAPPAAQPAFRIDAGATYCELTVDYYTGRSCVSDGDGSYSNSEACTIRLLQPGFLYTTAFETESCCDYLTVDGIRYDGTSNVQVDANSILTWSSDGSVTRSGWTLCLAAALPPPPYPPPKLSP